MAWFKSKFSNFCVQLSKEYFGRLTPLDSRKRLAMVWIMLSHFSFLSAYLTGSSSGYLAAIFVIQVNLKIIKFDSLSIMECAKINIT